MFAVIMLLLALLCLILAACGVTPLGRIHLGWLGLALITLVELVAKGLVG